MSHLSRKNRFLIIAVSLIIIDCITKLWVFNNLTATESLPVLGNFFGMIWIETMGFAAFSFYFRLLWLILFLFLFIRVRKITMPGIITAGATFAFIGSIGNYLDILLLGIVGGSEDFLLKPAMSGGISWRYLNTFYINMGFTTAVENLSSLMTTVGFFLLIAGALFRFRAFKKIFVANIRRD